MNVYREYPKENQVQFISNYKDTGGREVCRNGFWWELHENDEGDIIRLPANREIIYDWYAELYRRYFSPIKTNDEFQILETEKQISELKNLFSCKITGLSENIEHVAFKLNSLFKN